MELKPTYRNFEQTFVLLLEEANHSSISIKTILTTLSGKGKTLMLAFLSLGFAQIPGIAVVLGVFISYLGFRIAMGKKFILMPKFLLNKKISSYFLTKVVRQILKMLKFIKFWTRPRYESATEGNFIRVVNGFTIALVGLGIASCPPIPLVGLLASFAIFFIGIGLLNNDGIYIIIGNVLALFFIITVIIILNYFSFMQCYEYLKSIIS